MVSNIMMKAFFKKVFVNGELSIVNAWLVG
jgi:hypothetical protein